MAEIRRIIYPDDEGGICVLIPTGEMPFEDVCKKDVPAGKTSYIINATDVPTDKSFRDAWTYTP